MGNLEMKNKQFDLKRAKAKKYAKSWHRNSQLNEDGNVLYHCYPEPKSEGWWDDVAFKIGSQVVTVWWTHPRMGFRDQVEEQAMKDCDHLYPTESWLSEGEKIFKKIGKNKTRKRLVATRMGETPTSTRDWIDALRVREKELFLTTDVVIRPSMKIQQLDYGRGVDLCMPVEAVDEKSVNEMANLAWRLVRGETTLEKMFPGYTYSREDWAKEKFVLNGAYQ
jgi:hypothetical protein